jgi:hypothetical protein
MKKDTNKSEQSHRLIFQFLLHVLTGTVMFATLALSVLLVRFLRTRLSLDFPLLDSTLAFTETLTLLIATILFVAFIVVITLRVARVAMHPTEMRQHSGYET